MKSSTACFVVALLGLATSIDAGVVIDLAADPGPWVAWGRKLDQLGVSEAFVRKLIHDGVIDGIQAAACAPYAIPRGALDTDAVAHAVRTARRKGARTRATAAERCTLPLPGIES